MKIGLLVLMTSFLVFAHNGKAHQTTQWKMVGSIETTDFMESFKRLSLMDIDIAGVDRKNGIIDVFLTDTDFRNLNEMKMNVQVSMTKGVSRGPDQEYQNPEEVEQFLKTINSKYPNITHLESIGKSLEGRDIWALKISDNAQKNETNEPAVLFNSMHHAREVMGPEVGLDIIDYLTTNYNSDSKVTDWVNSTEIWVMPMFNVDGNNKMWSADSMWRKNVRGGYGVDLNRNYPTGWNSCNGSSGWRSSQTYRGPNPASEPETQAMMGFVGKIRPVFDISYHSYSELVIYPYGCKDKRTETFEVVEKIGKHIGKLLNYEAGTAWELLYNADGGDIDWMYEAYGVIPYVIELNSRSEGFHPDYARWRDVTVEKNRKGWMYLLDRLKESGVRGSISVDGNKLSQFTIEVFKKGKSKPFQTYLGHKTGSFHIVLNPGTYSLKFIHNNKTVSEKDITISSQLEFLNLEL